jgi:tetratricopeptide (TPR) repeat protein
MESKGLKNILVAFLCGFLLLASSNGLAQTDKQIAKAVKIFFNKSYDKGIEVLVKYINKAANGDGATIDGYEMWVKMEFLRYQQNRDIYDNITIEIETPEGEEPDSSVYNFFEDLKTYPQTKFINVCRKSTLESSSHTGDYYLRKYLVDYDPDSLRSEKAISYFDEGKEFMEKEDFELAELNFRKAWAEDSAYYSAIVSLGNTFLAREDYDSAIVYYNMAKNMHPDLLEPRKNIIDALLEKELYFRAKKECLEAFTVYPGFDVKLRYQIILAQENKYMDSHRFLRYFFPNNMKLEDQGILYGMWDTYRGCKKKISKYCSEDGIIEPNPETEDKYLEVYSFRSMLKEHENELPEYMRFGYKMMEEGYLECYVFFSMFHVDIYPQFKDYMSVDLNRVKTIEYIEKYLVERKPSN